MLKEPDRRAGSSRVQRRDAPSCVGEVRETRAGIGGPGNETSKTKDGLTGRWSEIHIRLW